jgi:hypothetical protein
MARFNGIRCSGNLRPAPHWITPEMVGRILALAMPVGEKTVPITTVPTRGVKPMLEIVDSDTANLPVTHSRLAEESEAAAIVAPHAAASPLRCWEVSNLRRKAKAGAQLEADRPLFQIAFDRGIALADLARTLRQNQATVLLHAKQAGFAFGRRLRLADPLTVEQLLALADPQIPTPELHRDRARRERNLRSAKTRREKRAPDVARRRAERARAAAERLAARATPKRKPPREAENRAEHQALRQAPSREPAPLSPARAHPVPGRARLDRAAKQRADAVRQRNISKAEALVDAGKSATRSAHGVHVVMAVRAVEAQRAEQTRLMCPIEQAKRILQRRYAPVCSMAVYGGDPDLYAVGHRKDVTREQLLAMAERAAA